MLRGEGWDLKIVMCRIVIGLWFRTDFQCKELDKCLYVLGRWLQTSWDIPSIYMDQVNKCTKKGVGEEALGQNLEKHCYNTLISNYVKNVTKYWYKQPVQIN